MSCRNHAAVAEVVSCARCGAELCDQCLVAIGGRLYCADCKIEQLLDVRSGLNPDVPDYASILRRVAAVLIDYALTWIPRGVMVALFGFGALSLRVAGSWNLAALIPAVISVAYQAGMLAARGQTIGKIALRIKVVTVDGSPISRKQAWGREITRAVLAFLYIVDYIPALFTDQRTTLHDLTAKTRVVNWA